MRLFLVVVGMLAFAQKPIPPESELEAAKHRLLVDGDIRAALRSYVAIVENVGAARAIRAMALFEAGKCYEKLGDYAGVESYKRLLNEYPEQRHIADQARQRLARLQVPPRPVLQRLAQMNDFGTFGSISPDGARLAYASFDDRIGLLDTNVGRTRFLTPMHAGGIRSMVFSPDGYSIAYGLGADAATRSLHVASIRDGATRMLPTPSSHRFLAPADWKGQSILIALEDHSRKSASLAVISLPTGDVRILRSFEGTHPLPARYSPDGRFVAFNLGADIHVMAVSGEASWPVVSVAGTDRLVGWADNHILFLSDRRGALDLWAAPVKDGRPAGNVALLHQNLDGVTSVGISRDGSYHYLSKTRVAEVFIGELDAETGQLTTQPWSADPASAGINGFADWSPDGTRLALWSTRVGGKVQLKIRHLETGAESVVPVELSQPGKIRWFPDGEAILTEAFDVQEGDRFYRVRVSDGSASLAVPIDLSRDASKNPAWLDSGRTLLFRARLGGYRSPGIGKLYTWDFLESRLREFSSPEEFGSWALSPSGRQLAFLTHESGADVLRIAGIRGGDTRIVYRTTQGQFLVKSGALAWSVDEGSVLAATSASSNPRVHELWRFFINGASPRHILTSGVLTDLRMHPLGRRFCFTANGVRQELWMLRDALPGESRASRLVGR